MYRNRNTDYEPSSMANRANRFLSAARAAALALLGVVAIGGFTTFVASSCDSPLRAGHVASGDSVQSNQAASDDAAPTDQIDFGDGTWTLDVDREWDHVSGNIRFPSDPLDESDYRPVADGPSYPVTVTQGTSAVSISDPAMSGTRDPDDDDRYYYDLTEGVFAGGRFVVWSADGGLQAELTIYGSGVPIISSERGALLTRPNVWTSHLPRCTR